MNFMRLHTFNSGSLYARSLMELGVIRNENGRTLHDVDFRDDIDTESFGKSHFNDSRETVFFNA